MLVLPMLLLWALVIGIGQLVKAYSSSKVFYILHVSAILFAFVGAYSYSFTDDYQMQSLPWDFFAIAASAPMLASLIIGLIQDAMKGKFSRQSDES